MTYNESGLTTLQYKLEWIDHLYELYADFTKRNDREQWIYFLNRPELANPVECEEISKMVLRHITQYGLISFDIIKMLEEFFHYTDNRDKYAAVIGHEAMEIYESYQLQIPEFPPYELFGELDATCDYDGFVNKFCDIYFTLQTEDVQEYESHLNELKEFGVEHPYTALLESELHLLSGALPAAAEALEGMPDGYYRQKTLGNILLNMQQYEMAEQYCASAIETGYRRLEPGLISDYLYAKWCQNKYLESFKTANHFIECGYENIAAPIKVQQLEQIMQLLMVKSESHDLSEEELLIIKEYYVQQKDYETVIEMGEISWEKGYEDDSWTIDMTEAYFETGQLDKAQQIIDLVNEGKKRLSLKGQLKLKEIKARLLFENDKTAEAYEIMNELCGRPESSVHQKYILAGMYMKTGNIKGAVKLLSVIKLYSDNLSYIYDLGRCMQEEQDYDYAHYLFIQVYMADPEFRDVAFMVGQTAVDAGLQKQMPDILKEIDTHITEYQKRYLQGEYKEMQSRFKDAQLIYAELIKDYEDGLYPEELLYDTYVRYLLMKEESDVRITKHIEEVKNILRRFTDAEAIWNYFGEFHCRIDSPDFETERCFKNVLRLNKYNKTAKMNLMAIYSQQEKWDITWDICTDLIVNTDWNDAYYYRALHGIELGRYEQSRADIECYESKGGDSNNCLIVRQHLAMKQGDYEEAIKQIETRLKNRKVSEVPCYDFYAICLCKLGRWQEAEELMDMVCETSRRPSFHGILYRIQKYNGRFSEARETLKRYKKLCDVGILDEEYPLLNLQLMLESGKGLLAQPMAEAIDSRDGERFVAMLEMFYGSTGKAARLFQKLVKNEPEEVNNYIWSAFTLYIKGKTQEAQQYAQAGLNAYEKNFGKIEITASPYRVCQYGLLKIFAGDSAEAKKLFELAEKMPTCTTSVCTGCYKAHCGLGIMYALNGYKDKADEEFNKSLEIRPYNTVCKKIKDKLLK